MDELMTKVKICGITNLEDARVAVDTGADLLGFIFYAPSPRYVAPEEVKEIVWMFKGTGDRVASSKVAETTICYLLSCYLLP